MSVETRSTELKQEPQFGLTFYGFTQNKSKSLSYLAGNWEQGF